MRNVSVVIPAFGAAAKLRACLASLATHLPPQAHVIVIDDATPDESVAHAVEEFCSSIPGIKYERSKENQGFVRTCNKGMLQRPTPDTDVLLLNSDTEVTVGFLEEMQAVLALNEHHGVVCPRSNDATILSVPFGGRLDPAESFRLWTETKAVLPRYQVIPTAVGFCMLIRGTLLARFGVFDEAYGMGYNEENDWVCRINRYGYSAVSANHAFVYHHSSSSFGSRREELDRRNRRRLVSRYPEYPRKVAEWVSSVIDPAEHFLHLKRQHKPRVLYDLSHLEPRQCGTAEFGLRLLEGLAPQLESDCDLSVALNPAASAFFANELTGYVIHDERRSGDASYDLVYKPCQIFRWEELYKMNAWAPRLCFTLQDIIGVRCDYLSSSARRHLVKASVELADGVVAISAATKADYEAFYGTSTSMSVIHHGAEPGTGPVSGEADYILIVGNKYAHKAIEPAVSALSGSGRVIVLGGAGGTRQSGGVKVVESGKLSKSEMLRLYAGARVVVYPSQYEGFGLPILEAVQAGKPVVAFRTGATVEVDQYLPPGAMTLVDSFDQLPAAVNAASRSNVSGTVVRSWIESAREYAALMMDMVRADIDWGKVRTRWEYLRTIESAV